MNQQMAFDFFSVVLPKKKKPPVHLLKYKLAEERLTAPVPDVEKMIPLVKKGARFSGGGQFVEEVHAKQYGEGVYSYFIIRTDTRTQAESIYSEAYMLREDDKLGMELESGYKLAEDLEKMGYKMAFVREIQVWSFRMGLLHPITVNAFSIKDVGDFIEVGLAPTKQVVHRERDEKSAFDFLKKLGIEKDQIMPTDALTLQMLYMQQQGDGQGGPPGAGAGGKDGEAPQEQEPQQKGKKTKGFGGDFKLG